LVLVAFPLLLLWRSLFAGEAFYWGTPLLQFVPWLRMAAGMWRSGQLPLWNPLVGCGAPLAANYQTAAFYPLNALHLLLPAETALSWTLAFHLALTGWGMYRWCRTVGMNRLPALVGALALEGSGFLVARVALFPSMALTFPWLAIWLWRGEELVQRERLHDGLWLGVALGLGLLAGHAQTAFYGGVLLAAYLIFRVAQRRDAHHAVRCASLAALALVAGLGLAGVQLLPTAELMMQSQRAGGVGYDFAMTYSFWPWRLITFLAPSFFGNPGQGDYWGYAAYWEDAAYVGLLPLLLVLRAVIARRREKQAWFWAVVAAAALVLALGRNTPVFPLLFRHIPTFDLFQAPTRWLSVTTVALAALAALGAQEWPVGRSARRRWALGAVVGAALLIGGLAAPRVVPGIPATFGPATAWLGGTLAVAGALGLMRRDTAWWRAAVSVFIVLDLLVFGWPLVPTVDRFLYRDRTEVAAALEDEPGPVRVYWPTDPTNRTRDVAEYRVKFRYLAFDSYGPRDATYWEEMREALLPNAAMLDEVPSASNFDPLLVGRYAELSGAAARAPGLLRVMGVTHVVSDREWLEAQPARKTDGVTLYRLPNTLGRTWIVSSARQVASNETLATLADPAFDLAGEVLLETEQLLTLDSESAVHSPQTAVRNPQSIALRDGPNSVTIRAVLDEPGYLVLADTWYPGWQAKVDDEPAVILRANYAFRAVRLEAGEHVVEMFYRPLSVTAGSASSLATLVMLAVGLALTRRGEARG
jgi:hypothetical protein